MVAVQVQQDIRQHSRAQKSISANQRAQNVGTLPKSRHSTFHFITIQIRAILAEQYPNYSSRIFLQDYETILISLMSISAKVLD